MKKKTNLMWAAIALFLTVLGSTGVRAQSSVVSVGNGTSGSSYLPSCTFCKYSMSQQIYTSAEIGKSGLITSIAFYNYDTGSERNYDIYLSHTSKTTFAGQTDWVKVTTDNKVFSGKVWLAQGVWTVIDFDTPFQYNGTQNLLITVDDNTGEDTGSNHSVGTYDGSSDQALYYYKQFSTSLDLDPTQTITEEGSVYSRKNRLQLCFETYPKPYKLEAPETGDISALIQWTLRGSATATNLRYRKVGDTNWTTFDNLTTRSKTIEGLTASTQYETQVQAVFAGGNKSDWTDALVFSTNCCPAEQQSTVNYALQSDYTSWYGFAVQIMDVTDAANPVEAAYLHAPSYELYKGSVSLCSDHTYQVNWIYDAEHENVNHRFTFSLTYSNGDALYTMDYDEAPSETATLTTFIMDDGDFDFTMPTQLTADETYQDATLGWAQSDNAKQWLVTYSKDPDFDPDEPEEDCIVLSDGYPFVLSELEENTTYYYAVRAVEVEDATEATARSGMSRAAKKVKVMKNGKIKVKVGDIWVTKSIKKLSRSKIKKILKSCDRWSRPKVLEAIVKLNKLSLKETYSLRSELPKARGEETRYNILTKTVTGEGTDVPLADIKSRVLEGNPEGIKKHTVSITSETTKGGFDNVIFIAAKKGSEVEFKMSQGVTGKKFEPYSVGWISNKKLGISNVEEIEDKTKVPDEKLKELLDENQRYEVKQPTETNMTKKIVEANDDTEGVDKAPQKATDETGEDGVLFIRHNTDGGGYLRVQEAKVIDPNEVKEWTSVSLPEGQMGHTDENVPPGSTILVKSEPVYKDGTTGLNSPITIVTTPSNKLAPLPGLFSVAPGKTVYFSKSNLSGWRYDDDFSLSEKQYTMKGAGNMSEGYPADEVDLYAWSTPKDYYGTAYGYGSDDEDVVNRFRGSFVDWGGSGSVISLIGGGWQTLTGSEWQYVLNERANAASRKAVATVADVKGLVLLPDEWTAPSSVTLISGGTYTDGQWTTLEEAGAVFLPAAGQFNDGFSLSDVGTKGYYWSSTPSDVKASATMEDDAYMMTFDGNGLTTTGIVSRRTGGAVRLVMCEEQSVTTAESGFTTLVSNATLDLDGTEGLTGYYATHVDDAGSEVTMTSISLVPANTPIVLKGSPNTTYRVKATVTSNTPPADNLLKGSATENTELAAGEAYILSGGKFVRNNAGTMPAGKAYLPATSVSQARQLTIIFGDEEATAIQIVQSSPRETGIYNLQGQRVKTLGKGLYIINGKKVFIK